jgi:hypothetical protein
MTFDRLYTVCLTPRLFQSAVMGLFHLGSVEEPGAVLMPQSIQSSSRESRRAEIARAVGAGILKLGKAEIHLGHVGFQMSPFDLAARH